MFQIVAVEHIAAGERPKFDEHLRGGIRSELSRVALDGALDSAVVSEEQGGPGGGQRAASYGLSPCGSIQEM